MIPFFDLAARLNHKSAECLRLQKRLAATEESLADALARFRAAFAREQALLARLSEAQEELRLEREKSAAYAKMAKRPRRASSFWRGYGDDIDEILRDAESNP